MLHLQFRLEDVSIGTSEEDLRPGRNSFARPFVMPMPEELADSGGRTPEFYLKKANVRTQEARELNRKLSRLLNGIQSELHGRASFAVSCLILVLIGCGLGMMFKTGNYLSAFALSVIPALLRRNSRMVCS